jgi:hypothetical protein
MEITMTLAQKIQQIIDSYPELDKDMLKLALIDMFEYCKEEVNKGE